MKHGPSLGKTLTTTALSNVALPLSALATGPILARTLEPEGRGELAAVLAPVALVVLLLTFGLPESITYHVARRRISHAAAVRVGVGLSVLTGVLATIGVVLTAPLILRRHPDGEGLLVALALTLPLIMGAGALRYVAQGSNRFDLVNNERWVGIGSRVILIVVLAVAGGLTVTSAAWATHGTAVLATAMLLPIALRRRRPVAPAAVASSGPAEPAPSLPASQTARMLLTYGVRGWVATLGALIVLRMDQVLVAPFAGTTELGYYVVAVSIAELPAIVLVAVREVMLATSAGSTDPQLVARATRTVIALVLPICLLGVLAAPVAVPLLFGDGFEPAVSMAQVLLVATVPGGIGFVLAAALLGFGRPRVASLAQAASAVVLVIGLVLVVPEHGGMGAAWVALAARVTAVVLTAAALVRITPLSVRDLLVPRPADVRALVERVLRRIRRKR